MSRKNREQLKERFRRGAYPTEGDFSDLMDSYVHQSDRIEISQVSGLSEALNNKYDGGVGADLERTIETLGRKTERLDATLSRHAGSSGVHINGLNPYTLDELDDVVEPGVYLVSKMADAADKTEDYDTSDQAGEQRPLLLVSEGGKVEVTDEEGHRGYQMPLVQTLFSGEDLVRMRRCVRKADGSVTWAGWLSMVTADGSGVVELERLRVTGSSELKSLDVRGAATFHGLIDVAGGGVFQGEVSIDGSLIVDGPAEVTGDLSAQSLALSGGLRVDGVAWFDSKVSVDDSVVLSDSLEVGGGVVLDDTLSVGGEAVFSSKASLHSGLSLRYADEGMTDDRNAGITFYSEYFESAGGHIFVHDDTMYILHGDGGYVNINDAVIGSDAEIECRYLDVSEDLRCNYFECDYEASFDDDVTINGVLEVDGRIEARSVEADYIRQPQGDSLTIGSYDPDYGSPAINLMLQTRALRGLTVKQGLTVEGDSATIKAGSVDISDSTNAFVGIENGRIELSAPMGEVAIIDGTPLKVFGEATVSSLDVETTFNLPVRGVNNDFGLHFIDGSNTKASVYYKKNSNELCISSSGYVVVEDDLKVGDDLFVGGEIYAKRIEFVDTSIYGSQNGTLAIEVYGDTYLTSQLGDVEITSNSSAVSLCAPENIFLSSDRIEISANISGVEFIDGTDIDVSGKGYFDKGIEICCASSSNEPHRGIRFISGDDVRGSILYNDSADQLHLDAYQQVVVEASLVTYDCVEFNGSYHTFDGDVEVTEGHTLTVYCNGECSPANNGLILSDGENLSTLYCAGGELYIDSEYIYLEGPAAISSYLELYDTLYVGGEATFDAGMQVDGVAVFTAGIKIGTATLSQDPATGKIVCDKGFA